MIGNQSAALERDLRRPRVLGVQFRGHLLDQMLVAVARIRARLVPHHNPPSRRRASERWPERTAHIRALALDPTINGEKCCEISTCSLLMTSASCSRSR